ncbi:class I SAM-dependent methyltransferase [Sinobaca sp. H24]|uniref:class I SAM-dependent methyltransferase n=1 Tax=Sinobaca sp. H24 TaxID=2923376 RepID=UPI00211320A1|nr:class I SAM-dependent methyltransferase [Sinobaca sp. H24]
MTNIALSKRLAAIAAFVKEGADVADIGTDHGILPIYLCRQNSSRKAVAADLRDGPLAAARKNIQKHHMEDRIELRLGSGVSVLKMKIVLTQL